MASDSQQYNGFTEDDLRKYEQEQRHYELMLDIPAGSGRRPRNHKERLILEYLAREEEQKKLDKWMVLGPINKPPAVPIEARFDKGADLNYITEALVRSLGLTKELLKPPQKINTAVGSGGECQYHVFANWQGRPGCGGRIEFFVLPETSSISKPLIGIEGKKFWDESFDEQPRTPFTGLR